MADKEMVTDIEAPSTQYLQTKELGTSADESLVKIRKPYTITKQREKWTEEEHEKFLEALKLHGRAWRRIQEHIGTKTAIQIRSHAQKFFSKVGREGGKEDAIEIPPPRPKRKPLHPYPRKVSHSNSMATIDVQKMKSTISSIPTVRQESRSPVSDLSTVGSDSGALISNPPGSSILPVSSPVGFCQTETLLRKHENGYHSLSASDVKDQISLSEPDVALTRNNELLEIQELDRNSKHLPSLEQDSPKAKQSTCLKLFGKDIVLTEPQKSGFSSSQNGSQILPNSSVTGDERTNLDVENASRCFKLFPSETDFLGLATSEAADMYNYLPYRDATAVAPLPLSQKCYGNGSLPSTDAILKEENSMECDDLPCRNTISPKRALISSTSKNILVTQGLGLPKDPAPAFRLKPSQSSAFSVVQACNKKPTRDFIPYKRCIDEQQAEKSSNMDIDRDIHAVELCL